MAMFCSKTVRINSNLVISPFKNSNIWLSTNAHFLTIRFELFKSHIAAEFLFVFMFVLLVCVCMYDQCELHLGSQEMCINKDGYEKTSH